MIDSKFIALVVDQLWVATKTVADLLNSMWAFLIFMGPMPWLVKPEVQVPVWVKAAAVIMMIVGFAMVRLMKIWYAAFVFSLFWMMGCVPWLAMVRPHLLLAAMFFAMDLDDWAEKNGRLKDVS